MLCNGSMTACGAVGVSSILTFRFRDVKSDERSEFDYFNSQEFKLPMCYAQRVLTFRNEINSKIVNKLNIIKKKK